MRLYYENAYLQNFSAVVTGCEKMKDGYGITLDRTAFYPEGGGQPYDTGVISNAQVLDVHERAGDIIHHTSESLPVGTEVVCKIDWERRFRFMQSHTGEHILSGILKKLYGLTNVGFHMGSEFLTIDVDGMLTDTQLEYAEKLANQGVYENIPVTTEFKSGPELDALEYRSKLDLRENVRIVHIDGYDTCACCGTHCNFTGDVGVIKVVNSQKYKSGMRIFLLCGIMALEDYAMKNKNAYDISAMLSAKPNEIAAAAKQLLEENANLGRSLSIFKNRVLAFIAEKIPDNTDCASVFESGLASDELRRLCVLIAERAEFAAVFSGDHTGYKYALGSKKHDVTQITARLNSEFAGRGGGKKDLTQGTVIGDEEKIRALIHQGFKLFS